jgi:3-oxoacyl-[acyl-carrier-protein] synthase III
MRFAHACIESIGYSLPQEIWTSADVERRLAPLYERLRLPEGRLELMTGIRERRVWQKDELPGDVSVRSGRRALEAAGWDPSRVGALVHGSVCRDHLEPATACRVHHELGLGEECVIYDLSNACLGLLNGMVQVAQMIELGMIDAGLVVGSESSRALLETTIDWLNANQTLDRKTIKSAVASLTIGSASAAILLVRRDLSRTGTRLLAATAHVRSQFHGLCQSGRDEAAADGMQPLMMTDSEALLTEGIETAGRNFERFLVETGWSRGDIQRSFCHQVGVAHRRALLERLQLPEANDYLTFDRLGNTGSAALPTALAIGMQASPATAGTRCALLGIGSGINCLMAGLEWNGVAISGEPLA